jgi:hypothetical protein
LYIILRLKESAVPAMHRRAPLTTETQELMRESEELGIALQPLHPGSTDPTLTPYFIAEVPDRMTAERQVTRLQKIRAIESAYIKPEDEMP